MGSKNRDIYAEVFADSTGSISFDYALQKFDACEFENLKKDKRVTKPGYSYWLRIKLEDNMKNNLVGMLGMHDSTCMYYLDKFGEKVKISNGYRINIKDRIFITRESLFYIPEESKDNYLYFNVYSKNGTGGLGLFILPFHVILNNETAHFAFFSTIIGISLIFSIFSLIVFLGISEKAYLFYGLYLLSFACYTSVTSGFSIFFIDFLSFNYIYFHIPFALMTIFLLLYSIYFLKGVTLPQYKRIIFLLILVRILLSVIGIATHSPRLLTEKTDYFMLCVPFLAGIYTYLRGDKFVIYYLIAFTMVFIGYLVHSYHLLNGNIYIIMVIEIVLFSYATLMKFRAIFLNNEKQSLMTIELQAELIETKDLNNVKLKGLVMERTKEIEEANIKLKEQAEEIEKMNALLRQDNQELTQENLLLAKARVLKPNVSYEDFHKMYPDELTCFRFLAELKSTNGYKCRKCSNDKYYKSSIPPYSRRCTKCAYLESAIAYTIFDNVHFSIDKAFYFIYTYYNNPVVHMSKLSEELGLRLGTCSNFKQKIQGKLLKYKSKRKKQNTDWTSFITLE